MIFRVVVALVVATFVSSCFSLTNADGNSEVGRQHKVAEVHRLRDGGGNHMESNLLDSSPLDNKSKRFHSKGALSAKVADQVALSRARQEKLDAIVKMSEERGFPIFKIIGGILLLAGIGWLIHGHFTHMVPKNDAAAAMGGMPAAH